jgi:hypothetical protein
MPDDFHPKRGLLVRVALWAMMALGVLLLVSFGVVPILIVIGAFIGTCSDERTDTASPDSRHIARSVVQTCQHFGPDVMVTQYIELLKAGEERNTKVFQSDMGGSASPHWLDDQNLDIEIGSKSTVTLSAHDFDSVRITYFVPQSLMTTSFSDTQIDERHLAGHLNDTDYQTLKSGNKYWREWEMRFIRWASENATIVPK